MHKSAWLIILVLTLNPVSLTADKSLKGIACRSVHLSYPAEQGTAFYSQVKVEQSAPGTYFMVCGWNTGYFGIQELADSNKVVLFSVWDAYRGNNPQAVPEDIQVKILHSDPDVKVSRFGGEGTGGKCMFRYNWKKGVIYHCKVTAQPKGKRTEYAGYFYLPEKKQWKHLVTFSTITGGKNLSGYYSFVEDFRRNRESTKKIRKAMFGQIWFRNLKGTWNRIQSAKFTADSNPVLNIDAGQQGEWFYLATGGTTENRGWKLRSLNQLKGIRKGTSSLPPLLKEKPDLSSDR